MYIGIDASKILISQKTGTENYSSSLVKAISDIDRKNQYLLYLNSDQKVNLFPICSIIFSFSIRTLKVSQSSIALLYLLARIGYLS